jgi:hypothetical protein
LLPHCQWSDAELESLQTGIGAARFKEEIARALSGERGFSLTALDDVTLGPFRQPNARVILRYYGQGIDGFSGSWREALECQRALTAEIKAFAGSRIDRFRLRGALELLPALEMATTAGARAETRQRCTIAAIAAQRYRLQRDRWPASLSEFEGLVPGGLQATDGFTDPIDGKPLRYRVEATRILIYGVGENESDDGGEVEQTQKRSLDVGISLKTPD